MMMWVCDLLARRRCMYFVRATQWWARERIDYFLNRSAVSEDMLLFSHFVL